MKSVHLSSYCFNCMYLHVQLQPTCCHCLHLSASHPEFVKFVSQVTFRMGWFRNVQDAETHMKSEGRLSDSSEPLQVAEGLAQQHFGWPRLRSFQPWSQVCAEGQMS